MAAPGKRIIRTAVDWSSAGVTLLAFLAGRFTYRSEAEWSERISSGEITLNGKAAVPGYILQMHDMIEYHPQDIPEPPARLDYRIVFEDETVLVVSKPGNLCVHPSGPFYQHTLWYQLRQKYANIHFINRLDRETSGLLVAAKTPATAAKIAETDAVFDKTYQVIVHGKFSHPADATGFLVSAESIIRKKRRFVTELRPGQEGESSITKLTPLQYNDRFSLVQAVLGTGRTHQIRATLCSLGFPIAGDKLYGVDELLFLKQKTEDFTPAELEKLLLKRQALHSTALTLRHPASGEVLNFNDPLPPELADFVEHHISQGETYHE